MVRHLSGQFEPAAVRKFDAEGQVLPDVGVADGVVKATAFREVRDARRAVCVSVPNGLQRDLHSRFSAAFAHIQFMDYGNSGPG